MRPTTFAALVVLLVATPAGAILDVEVEARPEPRGSILIDGDAAFTAENGVRGGSGGSDDPFVISDWLVVMDLPYAIRIVNTTAHVVIEDVVAEGRALWPACEARSGCESFSFGVHVKHASNVTISRFRASGVRYGLYAEDAADVTLAHARFAQPFGGEATSGYRAARWPSVTFGAIVADSRRVVVVGMFASEVYAPVAIFRSPGTVISDSTIRGIPAALHVENSDDVRILRNSMRDTRIVLTGDVARPVIAENDIVGGRYALSVQPAINGARIRDVMFCGNRVEGMTDMLGAVDLSSTVGATFVGNVFEGNREGVRGTLPNVTFERNRVSNSGDHGITIGSIGARIHNNSFEGNALGNRISRPSDARWNWWGDASGPSGVTTSGTGERLQTFGADVEFDPWLTSPPDTAVDCVPGTTRGARETAYPQVRARVRADDAEHEIEQTVPV